MRQQKFIIDGKEYLRTRCQVITRIMGYLRAVEYANIGKKSEFYSRKIYSSIKANNEQFNKQYG